MTLCLSINNRTCIILSNEGLGTEWKVRCGVGWERKEIGCGVGDEIGWEGKGAMELWHWIEDRGKSVKMPRCYNN